MLSSLHICIFGMNVSHYILMSYYNIQIGYMEIIRQLINIAIDLQLSDQFSI